MKWSLQNFVHDTTAIVAHMYNIIDENKIPTKDIFFTKFPWNFHGNLSSSSLLLTPITAYMRGWTGPLLA